MSALESTISLADHVALSAPYLSNRARALSSHGVQLPVEILSKAMGHLMDDADRARTAVEKDLSACAEACSTLCYYARAIRYKEMDLKLVMYFGSKWRQDMISNWSAHVKVVAPHLHALTIDWDLEDVMADEDVIQIGRAHV